MPRSTTSSGSPAADPALRPFAPLEDNSGQTDDAQAANEELDQFREDTFAVGTLGAVSYVVDGLRELPGRKSILLISDGFKIYNRDDPTSNLRALDALKNLVERASRASVVIYTMNATGLQTLGLTAADNTGGRSPAQLEQALSDRRNAAFDSQEGLDYLAKETGGLAIHNNNDLGGGIRKVMEDQKGYYLIGYRPDESTFDAKTGRREVSQVDLESHAAWEVQLSHAEWFLWSFRRSDEDRSRIRRGNRSSKR